MRRIFFVLAFAFACTPAGHELAAHSPAAAPASAPPEPSPLTPERPRVRRIARLAPPFASNPNTRRIEDAQAPANPLELASMR